MSNMLGFEVTTRTPRDAPRSSQSDATCGSLKKKRRTSRRNTLAKVLGEAQYGNGSRPPRGGAAGAGRQSRRQQVQRTLEFRLRPRR